MGLLLLITIFVNCRLQSLLKAFMSEFSPHERKAPAARRARLSVDRALPMQLNPDLQHPIYFNPKSSVSVRQFSLVALPAIPVLGCQHCQNRSILTHTHPANPWLVCQSWVPHAAPLMHLSPDLQRLLLVQSWVIFPQLCQTTKQKRAKPAASPCSSSP